MDAMNATNPMTSVATDDGLTAFGRFYKVSELAKHMKVAPGTLYAAIQAGELEAHSIGGSRGALRVEHTAFARYLDRCKTTKTAKALAAVA